jgi:hypothetical protein
MLLQWKKCLKNLTTLMMCFGWILNIPTEKDISLYAVFVYLFLLLCIDFFILVG